MSILKTVLLVSISILFGLLLYFPPFVLIVSVTLFFVLVVASLLKNAPYRRIIIAIFIISIIIRFFLSISHNVLALDKYGDLAGDATAYLRNGVYISEIITGKSSNYSNDPLRDWASEFGWEQYNGTLPHYSAYQVTGMSYLNGILYSLVGFSPLSTKFLNSLISILTAVMIYFFLRDRLGHGVAIASYFLVVFTPSLILWSVTGLKESIIIFSTFLTIALWSVFLNGELKYKGFVFMIVIFAIMYFLIPTLKLKLIDMLLVTLSLSLLLKIFAFRLGRQKIIIYRSVLIFALALTLIYMSLSHRNFFISKIDLFLETAIARSYSSRVHSKTKYYVFTERYWNSSKYDTPLSKAEIVPSSLKAISYFLFSPFPWDLHLSKNLFFLYPQSVATLLIFPFMLLGIYWTMRHWPFLFAPFALFLLIYVFGVSLVVRNIGTAVRFKDIILPIYLMFSTIGFYALFNPASLIKPARD